jgi:ADP-ribose pyrophosphatase
MSRFKWQSVETQYREARPSHHGTELRWILNVETILDTQTGHTTTRGVVRHPGISVIVPVLDGGGIALMRQYRYSLDDELWEIPAGTLNGVETNGRMSASESPLECARRELLEETGYEAERIEPLIDCYTMPGSNDEVIHLYAAYGLTRKEQDLDIGEMIFEVREFSVDEIWEMIRSGQIRDAKTLIGLFYVLIVKRHGV